MLPPVPAAGTHRRLLLFGVLALYAAVFTAFPLFEVPGLGIGHFFYLPVALLALGYGMRVGIAGGLLAAALYALAIVVTPTLPVREVLTVATAIRLFTFSSVGGLIGWVADQHRRDLTRLRELAERDFLTNLLNTRVFDEALARRCESNTPFVLLLADMDNLKDINDAHGHSEGNTAIRRVADVLAGMVGTDDELARVGGDEFAVLTARDAEGVKEFRARVRERLRRDDLTLSIGWAASPSDGTDPVELFRKADDRLYAAKLVSRNRRAVAASAVAESSFSAS
jgi:diguanylate cyclase (GGDEF)-like protein